MAKNKPSEAWQRLIVSSDITSDLRDIYSAEFMTGFAHKFDRSPQPADLVEGVYLTAQAYLTGKQQKAVEKSKMLTRTGTHILRAGLAAQQLAYELKQISKSHVAAEHFNNGLNTQLQKADNHGSKLRGAQNQFGPQNPLMDLRDLCTALEAAADEICHLPRTPNDRALSDEEALAFPDSFNTQHRSGAKRLAKNHAIECAAAAFRPMWEAFSDLKYIRGRYYFERRDYNSKPGQALHMIVRKLDSRVAESLAGTAIENTRERSDNIDM